jgi:hypothetical protein
MKKYRKLRLVEVYVWIFLLGLIYLYPKQHIKLLSVKNQFDGPRRAYKRLETSSLYPNINIKQTWNISITLQIGLQWESYSAYTILFRILKHKILLKFIFPLSADRASWCSGNAL